MNGNGGNGDTSFKLPVFDGKNWNRWKIQMRVLFCSQDVLDLVTDGYASLAADAAEAQKTTQKAIRKKDQKALFYIHQCVDVNVFEKVAWDTLVRCYGGEASVKKVFYMQGGVARNVAECMSKLGAKPYMISALGFDMAGNLLLEQWKTTGLSKEGILKNKDIETPVVCNIFDVNGEVAAGVASVEALEKYLTPDWILRFKRTLLSAPVLMVDANLSGPSLEASCKMAADTGCPVWFEPVSVTKSRRIGTIAKYVTFASPNEDELIAMANALSSSGEFHPLKENHKKDNISTESLFQILKPAVLVLLEKGIKVVLVTLGSSGVFLCSKGGPSCFKIPVAKTNRSSFSGQLYNAVMHNCPPNYYSGFSEHDRSNRLFAVHLPSLPASVVRLTGAGDCLVGGTLSSICAGLDIMQSVSVGIAAAKAAVEEESNVPSAFGLTAIADDAKFVFCHAKVLFHQSML